MPGMRDLLFSMVSSNPQVASNPIASNAINVLKSGTQQQKQQLLDNMCRAYGMDQNQLAQSARQFLMSQMGQR